MSLEQLDAFIAHAQQQPELQARLRQPLDLEEFLALAQGAGYPLQESDVIAAQLRQEQQLRAGLEARKLRNFILA
jgi:predicted ribosomally synthesized peptide with nif11-like leader